MWVYHGGVELPRTNYTFLYKVNEVRQGFSKGEDAGEGLLRRRGEAPTRTRAMGNVMQIQEARALPSHAAPASAVPLLHGLACRGSGPLCHPRPDAQLTHLPVPLTGSVPLPTGFSPPCVRSRLPERHGRGFLFHGLLWVLPALRTPCWRVHDASRENASG
jgi:hypothetical protein